MKTTALDADPALFDPGEREFVETIREHGWFQTNVFEEADSPGFCFTTGFWVSAQAPELIIFSMRGEVVNALLWDLYRRIRAGLTPRVGMRFDDLSNHPLCLMPVAKEHYFEHLGWSRWFYAGDDFPCLQLVWSDPADRFPWEPGFDPDFAASQPDLSDGGWTVARVQ